MSHKHWAQMEQTFGWSKCVGPSGCNGKAHGGVVFVAICACGARRYTEGNGVATSVGPWVKPEESYRIYSCKQSEVFKGTRKAAQRRARQIEDEYQPALGVSVERIEEGG